jgi:hypothetical protein
MEPTIEQDANVERPREVTRGVQFLTSSLAIGLLKSLFNLAQSTSGIPMIFASLIVIAVFGIGFVLIWRISALRWMKILNPVLLTSSAALAAVALMDLISAKYVAALAFAIASVLAYAVYKRRNWARIIVLVLILFGLPFAIPANLLEVRRNVLSGTISIIVTILQLIGTYLLFTRNSNRWFKTRK